MTRKRFVKLLMANGVSRNMAGRVANTRPERSAYEDYYKYALLLCAFSRVGVAAKKASEEFSKLSCAMAM